MWCAFLDGRSFGLVGLGACGVGGLGFRAGFGGCGLVWRVWRFAWLSGFVVVVICASGDVGFLGGFVRFCGVLGVLMSCGFCVVIWCLG